MIILHGHTINTVTTIFCHGIINNNEQMLPFIKNTIISEAVSFDFPDAVAPCDWDINTFIYNICNIFGKKVNRNNMYMGQGKDIQTLHETYTKTVDDQIILYGVSRGGSAILSYVAEHNPNNLKAIVLESSPANMLHAINNLQQKLGIKLCTTQASQEALFRMLFPAYPTDAMPPIQSLNKIKNKDLPICIVHAKTDSRVSISESYVIYSTLKKYGFKNIYLVELENGKHGFLYQAPSFSIYKHAINSFYKTYDLPYDENFAVLEYSELCDVYQPSEEEINHKLMMHRDQQDSVYRQKNTYFRLASRAILISTIGMIGYMLQTQLKNYCSTLVACNKK